MAREPNTNTSRMKRTAFRVAVMLMPVVILLVVEGALRLFGVGRETRTPFVPVEGRSEYLALSTDFAARYFSGFTPGVAFNPFKPQKPEGTFRVFALGGSSTAGFPYSFYYAFPARLQTRLESYIPDLRVEVINLGMTAVNSYTLWDLARYLPEYDPDAVVIYAGHNEYYGAFGAGSTMYSLGNQLWLKRLTLRLKGSALYTLLERLLVRAPKGADAVAAQGRTLMAQIVDNRSIELGDDVYEAGLRQFRANIGDVVDEFSREGVPVYIATLASNLRGQRPLGTSAEAAREFAEATRLAATDAAAARSRFIRAKDLDNIRFRAPEAINQAIREIAGEPGVTLVDVESSFRRNAARGIEGDDEFVDHLHPNFAGYDRIAERFYAALSTGHPTLLKARHQRQRRHPPAIDPVDRASAAIQIQRLRSGFPFRDDVEPEVELRAYRRLLDRYTAAGYTDSLAALSLTRTRLIYDLLYDGVGMARARADTMNVLLMYRALLSWQPFNTELNREAVRYALGSKKWDWLTGELASALFNRTGDPDYLDALAAIRLRNGDLEDAGRILAEIEKRNPTSAPMLYNTARLYVMRGDSAAARTYLERFRQQSGERGTPPSDQASGEFVSLIRRADGLREQRKLAEALDAYREALAIQPDNLALLTNIATLELHLGQEVSALRHYRQVVLRDSTVVEVWINLAAYYIRTGRVDEARDAVDRVSRYRPDAVELSSLREGLSALSPGR